MGMGSLSHPIPLPEGQGLQRLLGGNWGTHELDSPGQGGPRAVGLNRDTPVTAGSDPWQQKGPPVWRRELSPGGVSQVQVSLGQ